MDLKTRAELVRQIRVEAKQRRAGSRVDMTVRPPPRGTRYTDDQLRVQRDIVRSHPLNSLESIAASKLRRAGTPDYEAYWTIRNNRYDSGGRSRRSRRTSFSTGNYGVGG